MEKNDIVSVVEKLQTKYESDPYMCVRFQNFICNQLPNILESMALHRQQRVVRTETLTLEYDSFIKAFMNTNK